MSARQFDNLCKYLSEKYPNSFASWLLGRPMTVGEVIKSELSIEPIRADSVTFLRTQERILLMEFEVEVDTTPPLPLRMLDYWVRLHRRYLLPVTQVGILLKKPTKGELAVVIRLLTRQIGAIPDKVRSQIEVLPLPQLGNLAEALLDFTNLSDLVAWLETN